MLVPPSGDAHAHQMCSLQFHHGLEYLGYGQDGQSCGWLQMGMCEHKLSFQTCPNLTTMSPPYLTTGFQLPWRFLSEITGDHYTQSLGPWAPICLWLSRARSLQGFQGRPGLASTSGNGGMATGFEGCALPLVNTLNTNILSWYGSTPHPERYSVMPLGVTNFSTESPIWGFITQVTSQRGNSRKKKKM